LLSIIFTPADPFAAAADARRGAASERRTWAAHGPTIPPWEKDGAGRRSAAVVEEAAEAETKEAMAVRDECGEVGGDKVRTEEEEGFWV
jgi:hypothetical protein